MIPLAAIAAALRHGPWVLLAWVALLAFLFAKLEIQIEGPHGWAAHLPTWRLPKTSRLRMLFGNREVTGYHVYAFAFMAAAFHLPLVLCARFSLALEARVLASLVAFWILEDFLWFALNPAFGLSRFDPRHIPWHPHWLWRVPVDYLVMAAGAVVLFAYSYGAFAPPSP
jgi:hypothetical protein